MSSKLSLVFGLCLLMILPAALVAGESLKVVGKGIKIGYSMAKFSGGDDVLVDEETGYESSPENRSGLVFGGFLTLAVSPSFSIQPEFYYLRKGARYKFPEYKIAFKINYFEVPVLLKYIFRTGVKTEPNLFLGPAVSFKNSSKVTGRIGNWFGLADLQNVKGVDLGLVFGGGLDFIEKYGRFSLDIRYNMGISKIAGSDAKETVPGIIYLDDNADLKNNAIIIFFGYAF